MATHHITGHSPGPAACLAALLAACVVAAPPAPGAEPRPPNVLLIVADDLGWADVGYQGADLHETPNIDRLAAQRVRFSQAYAASVCSPTRASLMTGLHPARLGITTWSEAAASPPRDRKLIPPVALADLPLERVTIAERLREASYLTALVGKWHLGDAAHYPEAQGFDVNIGGTLWGAPQTFFYPYRGRGLYGDEYRYVPHLELGREGEYLTDRLTEEALKLIDAAGSRPFFLEVAHHAPHTPIEAKPELVARYEAKAKSTPGLRHRNAAYAAMVRSLDEGVGRLLARLDERGLADRTVVVFTSDNGGFINNYKGVRVTDNAPLRSGKGSLYEGGIRVPLIVRWPGLARAGGACDEPVAIADLFPTLLEAGRPGSDPGAIDGTSLVPLLRDPSARLARDALYFHFPHYYATTTPVGAIREGGWKLLEYFEDDRVELYRLEEGESHDLAAARPGVGGRLRRRLRAWRVAVGARLPTPNPDARR